MIRIRLRVREIAEKRGMSISRLHRAADVTYHTVKDLFEDPYKDVNLSTLVKIAQALDVPFQSLFDEEIIPDPPRRYS